ncbi:hypothetical protein Vafri_2256 [Volvox africanus]|nr:hypothetical protein Vafri_2256 [Volvox africanus]
MSGRMFRTPTCNLMYGPYNCSMLRGINTPQLDAEQLPGATSCGINVPAPDQLTPQLVQSYIWSWAEGHMPLRMAEAAEAQRGHPYASTAAAALTADGEGSCVVLRSRDGRWEVRPSCNGASFAACRRNAGPQHVPGADAWALGPLETAIGATAPCPQGYLQSAPHTARENWELWQLLKRQQHNLIQQQSIQQQSRWAQLNDPTEWGLDSTLGGAHGKISPSGRGAKKTYQAVTGIIARDRHLCTHCGTGDKPSRYDAGRGSFPSGDGHGRMRSTLELVRPQRGALREKSSSEAFQPQVTTPLQGREAGPGLVTEAEVEVEMIPVAAGGNAPLSSDYQQSEQQRQRQPQHMGSGVLGGIPIGDVEVEVLVVLTLDRVSWLPVDLV